MRVARRRSRVSGRLAETTQKTAVLRYDGDWAENHCQAFGSALKRAS